MFERLIEKIQNHPTYGPALRQAIEERWPLVLNYHHHGDVTSWCVAICTTQENLIPLLGPPERLHELAHVRGLGRSEEDCLPLMGTLARELVDTYELAATPTIYKQGRPLAGE